MESQITYQNIKPEKQQENKNINKISEVRPNISFRKTNTSKPRLHKIKHESTQSLLFHEI